MARKNLLRLLIVILGILIGLPIWALSGLVLWGIICGLTTMLILDLTMCRPYPARMKLICLALYVIAMICVLVWIFSLN
ncbi:MAG: hypothetical protein Q4C56_05075 [Peptococcaceae bacterium]|nr:hypothetical protein [Peptococcaceae bacterium]